MANWSYNGAILSEFPTDYGEYSEGYTYRVLVYHEGSQRWFARASAAPFVVRLSSQKKTLYATDSFGDYYIPAGETEWVLRGYRYAAQNSSMSLEGATAFRLVWANHDVFNTADGSLYLAENVPISPDSVITGLTLSAGPVQLRRGESFQFAPEVEGTEVYSDRVDYSIGGNDANGGTTLSRTGLLTVGETEYASRFTVTAASRQDPAVTQTVTVEVTDHLSKLNLEILTDMYGYNGEVLPAFPTYFGKDTDNTYQYIVWEEKRKRWYAMGSASPFTAAKQSNGLMGIHAGLHGQYYLPVGGREWVAAVYDATQSHALYIGDSEWGYRVVWANHDIINRGDQSVYFEKSDAVRICTPVTAGGGTEYRVIGPAVLLDGTCGQLNKTEEVYTVKAWLYPLEEGLNTALPPTWTSQVFGGPEWSQRWTFTDLLPFTRYGVYAVICVDGVATDHHWQGFFTTMQTDTALGLAVTAETVKPDGFTLSVARSGLESATEYIAEIIVYHPDTSQVVFAEKISFFGDGTDACTVTGLESGTGYAVSVDVYPAPAGAVVVRGDYFVTTAPEQTGWSMFAGVSGLARPVRAVYVGVNGRARRVRGIYLGVNGRAQPL